MTVVALLFNRNGFLAISRLMNERSAVSTEIDSLTTVIDSLHMEIEMLQTDSATMERVVREILGWGRPGEVIIRFVPSEGMEDSL
jgi:cell division protein FtsB